MAERVISMLKEQATDEKIDTEVMVAYWLKCKEIECRWPPPEATMMSIGSGGWRIPESAFDALVE